ncbi:MAG: hypothetical protein EA396_02005 [Anaerolineaceae bacterium]|nr:MAG: hypothetical protein EA396_02005 [Anaerolineaceae bacterium]
MMTRQMMQTNLFNEVAGFRLARLEIYNWGTFDGEIWTMTPDGQTAVLTGANGSGKSTAVDALLTLLVESNKRKYNLASGEGSRRERNERTYIRGYYSRSRGENAIDARANTLRDTGSHSVLLAVFRDDASERLVTLAAVLWISNADKVERRYYVAPFDLNIERHFPGRHITGRHLPDGAQTFKTFKDYIAAVRKALGLSGRQKALDLFNQTVAVKEIASLNQFVRDHMLDEGEPEKRVEALRGQYRELNDAHAAIQRAGRQLEILRPLVKSGEDYRRYETQIAHSEAAKRLVPLYVAERARDLLTRAIDNATNQRAAEQDKLKRVDGELEALRGDLQDIEFAIQHDSVGQMTREIEGRLKPLSGEINALRRAADSYDEYARSLDLPTYQDETAFHDNRTRAESLLEEAKFTIQELEAERLEAQTKQKAIVAEAKTIAEEIDYLRANPSQIPARVADIRGRMRQALGASPDDLPFVGELLRVRDGESAWEGALERLLHSFAQELLVPDALYDRVSDYVERTNLRGRLVYRRISADQPPPRRRADDGQGLPLAYQKLDIHPDTPHHDWLAARLLRGFAYACCESLDDFRRVERAITPQGQVKHGASRHEKDDRRAIDDRRNYVLGWDNRAKLQQLETELDDLHRQLTRLSESVEHMNGKLERHRRDIGALNNLLKVTAFDDIDYRSRQAEYDNLQKRLDDLRQQADELGRLEKQRDDAKRQIKQTQDRRDKVNNQIALLDNRISTHQRQLTTAERQLSQATPEDQTIREQVGYIVVDLDNDRDALTIETLQTRVSELEVAIQGSIASLRGYLSRAETTITRAMHTLRQEYPDVGASLTDDISALPAYERIYHQLEHDDLPQYQDRFKDLLDRKISNSIMTFAANLEQQERAIERSINELNESLARVDYGGGSHIQLIAEATRDAEINDFRRDLRGCIPDAGDNSPAELERAYERIKALITRFDDDPNWMRRVIDVRRWRTFAAEQIAPDGGQIDYYSDSSGKSGGQKAKLAYTILASAIAHQYGLQDAPKTERSFRFVVIDEAFSKLDDDNARYAMQLFGQLGLQLLVVTPMQQLHVIENYVRAYHVVVNNDAGSCSRLFNLTQSEYRARRREFQAEGHRA